LPFRSTEAYGMLRQGSNSARTSHHDLNFVRPIQNFFAAGGEREDSRTTRKLFMADILRLRAPMQSDGVVIRSQNPPPHHAGEIRQLTARPPPVARGHVQTRLPSTGVACALATGTVPACSKPYLAWAQVPVALSARIESSWLGPGPSTRTSRWRARRWY